MKNSNKKKLLDKLNMSIKTHSKVRKLTPQEATLTLEESEYIKTFPQLLPNRYRYEFESIDGRPALKVTDTFLPTEELQFSTYFVPTHNKEADGYSTLWIQDIVRKLNAFDNIRNMTSGRME